VNRWQWVCGQCGIGDAALSKEFNDSVGFDGTEGWTHSRERRCGCGVVGPEMFEATNNGLDWASDLVLREAMSDDFSPDGILLVGEDESDKGCRA
jgi:hypothetical protein